MPSAATQPGATFTLDQKAIEAELEGAPREGTRAAGERPTRVFVPRPDGSLEEFEVVSSPVMEPGLAKRHPEIQTYAGRAVDDPTRTIRLDVSPLGLNATVQGADAYEVEPTGDGSSEHVAYHAAAAPDEQQEQMEEDLLGHAQMQAATEDGTAGEKVGLRTYRLALITDHTYAATVRDPQAPAGTGWRTTAAKVALVNRVNAILERDWAARLVLVNDNDKLNLDTPAMSQTAGGPCGDIACYTPSELSSCGGSLDRNIEVAGLLVGARNYDVGHLVMSVNTGGVAYLASAGREFKAGGCSGNAARSVTRYWLAMVFAHELGHQFGADHTYSSCNFNTNGLSGVEPGGGVTIMAYPGICGRDDVQADREGYFSHYSLAQFHAAAAAKHRALSSTQQIRLRDFGAGDSYRLTYGGGKSVPISAADHTAAVLKSAIEGIPGWPVGATVNVTGVSHDQALITFGGTLAGVRPEMLGVADAVGTELVIGERVAGGVPTNGGTLETTDNHHPVISAPAEAKIPLRTPFELTAQGADSDGDPLTYLWEQTDGSQNGRAWFTDVQRARGPLFSVFSFQSHQAPTTVRYPETDEAGLKGHPTAEPSRSFPDIAQVVADNTNASTGDCPSSTGNTLTECRAEVLPTAAYVGTAGDRTMGFRATARDNHPGAGGTAFADTKVTIDPNAGPFRVTSPAPAPSTAVEAGATLPVTWNVAGTDLLSDRVNIRLSLDGGRTFPHTLAADTPNDGAHDVEIPATALTWRGVLKVQASGGVWYDAAHTLLVTRANRAPVAVDDSAATDEDTPARLELLANDTDEDADALVAEVVDAPDHGTLARGGDGSLTYTPFADYHGSDSFTYKASDTGLVSEPATVDITVRPVNDKPAAQRDSMATDEETTLMVAAPGVLGNDWDVEQDALTARVASEPAHGTLTLAADGSVRYVPNANYSGTDRFTYTASDGHVESSPVPVLITVRPINDPPVARADALATDEDVPLELAAPGVLGNDSDPDGDPLTAAVEDGPKHGTLALAGDGSLRYVPNADYSGSDRFTYTLSDGQLKTAPVQVEITVRPVNDAPVVGLAAVACGEDDHSGTFRLSFSDVDSPAETLTVTTTSGNPDVLPSTGVTVTGAGAERTLTLRTAEADSSGVAPLTIRVSDGEAATDEVVTVVASGRGADRLDGTEHADLLLGYNGDDVLAGLAGPDVLCGGRGDDTLSGGAGADLFGGGRGVDTASDFEPLEGDSIDGTLP